MFGHRQLVELSKALGYQSTSGMCHGYALSWAQAVCISSQAEQHFYKRIQIIKDLGDIEKITAKIKQAYTNLQRSEQLGEALLWLDVQAWLDVMNLYHSARQYLGFFDGYVSQIVGIDKIMAHARPVETDGKVFNCLYQRPSFLNTEELKKLLFACKTFVGSRRCAFIIHGFTHTVAISWQNRTKKWRCVDANGLELASPYWDLSTDALVKRLVRTVGQGQEFIPFNLKLIASSDSSFELSALDLFDGADFIKQESDRKTRKGMSSILWASFMGHTQVVKCALAAGQQATAAYDSWSALTLAAKEGFFDTVSVLLENSPSYPKKSVIRALNMAIKYNHPKVVNVILTLSTQLDKKRLPICYALKIGHAQIAKLLIEQSENVNIVDCKGLTPLMRACIACHDSKIFELLLAKGAYQNIKNRAGKTALDLARDNNNTVAQAKLSPIFSTLSFFSSTETNNIKPESKPLTLT